MNTALAALDRAINERGGPAAVLARNHEPMVRSLNYVLADSLPEGLDTFDDELIEGIIGREAMAVLYGDSNSGKTFLAIDLAASICRGTRWMGRPTDRSLVIYLATEAPSSVELRARAYRRHYGQELPGLVIVKSPINLYDGDVDVAAVVALVAKVEAELGEKVGLLIADTLSRISAGANENSGEDMGVVIKHAEAIRAATKATFLWIHHCGKDQARGMRGWSGMRAAIDTEIEVTEDAATGVRTAEITKQRDLPGKGERIGFRLESVHMGFNKWGTARSSAVVLPADAPAKRGTCKRPSEIAGAIVEVLTQRGTGMHKGTLVKHFDGRYTSSAVYREIRKMVEDGRLHEVSGIVDLIGGAN
jgi:putative DNA primase/helicase